MANDAPLSGLGSFKLVFSGGWIGGVSARDLSSALSYPPHQASELLHSVAMT